MATCCTTVAKKSVTIELTRTGEVRMLYDSEVNLHSFGNMVVVRASHVEFDNDKQWWQVRSAKTGKVIAQAFNNRDAALRYEKKVYSPGGIGWKELCE